jgi:hypothetical protein
MAGNRGSGMADIHVITCAAGLPSRMTSKLARSRPILSHLVHSRPMLGHLVASAGRSQVCHDIGQADPNLPWRFDGRMCDSTGTSGLTTLTKEPRNRLLPLKVFVREAERQRIEARAQAAGLSISAYLRAAGIGHPIRSTLDHAAVLQLAKVNDDQGRLGGLLKLWLVEKPGQGAPESEVRRLLDRLGELQTRLAEIAGRM